MEITLTHTELFNAAIIGVLRQIAAVKMGLTDRHGCKPEDGFKVHIQGAIGELVVAKATGRYWPATVNTFKGGGDLGVREQVRLRTEDWHELIVRADDRDEDRFVLVIGSGLKYRVVGWIGGGDAKLYGRKGDPGERGECWLVGHQFLEPVQMMPK